MSHVCLYCMSFHLAGLDSPAKATPSHQRFMKPLWAHIKPNNSLLITSNSSDLDEYGSSMQNCTAQVPPQVCVEGLRQRNVSSEL